MTPQEMAAAGFEALNRGDYAAARRLFHDLGGIVPDWVPGRFGLGMALFQLGDYAGAAPLLEAAVAAGIGLPESWRYQCHALAMTGEDAALPGALARSTDPLAKAALAFQICNNFFAEGQGSRAPALLARLPADEPALLLAASFWAAIGLVDTAPDRAVALFKAALGHGVALREAGIETPLLTRHLGGGGGLETDGFVLAVPDGPLPAFGTVSWLDPPVAASPDKGVFVAAANGDYIEAFAADCVASLAALGDGRTLHLHIVNPPPDLPTLLAGLRAAAPGVTLHASIEHTAGPGDAVYYACARFLLLPALLLRYRTTMMVIDIDCLFRPAAAALPDVAAGADVALFRVETVFPWLRHPAAMVIVRDRPGGHAFARLVDGFLRRKLQERRNWTLDQAALFSVLGALGRHHPEIKTADLGEGGLTLDDLVASQGSFAEKRALRLAAR